MINATTSHNYMKKSKYFCINDGEIISCATNAKTDEEASEACDTIDANGGWIEIDEKTVHFINAQFFKGITILK